MEKRAARRFMGKPRENLRSLMLKPRFDLDIIHHFRREDFHPKPGVDVVMIRLRKRPGPMYPPSNGVITSGLPLMLSKETGAGWGTYSIKDN